MICNSFSTPIKTPIQSPSHKPQTITTFITPLSKIKTASSRKETIKKNSSRSPRNPHRLITISTSDGKWHGQWSSDYIFSLDELDLADLVEDGQKSTEVSVNLLIHKHVGFGFSIDGRITTSFTRKCSNCFSTYCRKIDTTFDVWVLPSSKDNNATQLPEIGGDDPSVIYVKPGDEADLDSLIQDTIRLATSFKETCSKSCKKPPTPAPKFQYIGRRDASIDKRWSKLLELKNAL